MAENSHQALNPGNSVTELVQEVIQRRSKIEEQLGELQQLTERLRREIRRTPDIPSGYLVFVNANFRITGALSNGLKRATAMDRVLNLAEEEDRVRHREAEEDASRRATWERKQELQRLQSPTAGDFDALYGDVVDAEDTSHA